MTRGAVHNLDYSIWTSFFHLIISSFIFWLVISSICLTLVLLCFRGHLQGGSSLSSSVTSSTARRVRQLPQLPPKSSTVEQGVCVGDCMYIRTVHKSARTTPHITQAQVFTMQMEKNIYITCVFFFFSSWFMDEFKGLGGILWGKGVCPGPWQPHRKDESPGSCHCGPRNILANKSLWNHKYSFLLVEIKTDILTGKMKSLPFSIQQFNFGNALRVLSLCFYEDPLLEHYSSTITET